MALGAGTVFEVNSSGDDSFGGGFNPANANFATDLTATGGTSDSPVVTSASYTFDNNDIGHKVFIQSGSGWTPGWYVITAVNAGAATLNAAVGAVVLYQHATLILNAVAGVGSASPTGGVFGVDYSQKTTTRISFTDMVIDGTTNTKFTSAAHPVGKNYIGNIINVASGTGFTVQFVEIVSTVTTTATCDKSLGTLGSTGGTGKLGGCLATIGKAGAAHVGGNPVYVKGAQVVTSASSNVAGGCFTQAASPTLSNISKLLGYSVYRGDRVKATITQSGLALTYTYVTLGTNGFVENFDMTGDLVNLSRAIQIGTTNGEAVNCIVRNFSNGAINSSNSTGTARDCYGTGCSTQFVFGNVCAIDCVAVNNTCTGFKFLQNGQFARGCISAFNTSGGTCDGFLIGNIANTILLNCTAYGNDRDNFRLDTGFLQKHTLDGCVSWGGVNGFNVVGQALDTKFFFNCAAGGASGSNFVSNATRRSQVGTIILTADPFTNAASGDFSLNRTSGGGSELRDIGATVVFQNYTSTVTHRDLGAAQSENAEVPDEEDVREGVQYGAGGTEFTGTLDVEADNAKPVYLVQRAVSPAPMVDNINAMIVAADDEATALALAGAAAPDECQQTWESGEATLLDNADNGVLTICTKNRP